MAAKAPVSHPVSSGVATLYGRLATILASAVDMRGKVATQRVGGDDLKTTRIRRRDFRKRRQSAAGPSRRR